MTFSKSLFLLFLSLLLVHTAHATCEITGKSQTEDDRAAKLAFGRINVTPALLSHRTPLASITVPLTNYTYGGAQADTVLWKCDKEDLNEDLHFLVSTNGDSHFGGEFELADDGVYGTWFNHIGLRQTMGNVTLKRHWQRVPLTTWLPVTEKVHGKMKERIHIRLMDIPQDHYHLQLDFTAKLVQLPGETATLGKVQAAANVLVKVQ